ncbi:MAG: UDP-glucose 4-epimerase GalE [Sulfurimonadaceae bacterium]|nr:UDP-glucose 4-epimerase GalE [Candidatus Cloacimonadota bacterium]
MNILITGGAGYIGSHVVKLLGQTTQHNIIVLDNLSTGFQHAILYGKLVICDLSIIKEVEKIFQHNNFDIIIHFAASIDVSESLSNPLKYYENNTLNSINLIKMALKYKVKKFIFSSTAAVYGNSKKMFVNENDDTQPLNPYGWSKLMTERILMDMVGDTQDFEYIILRYFNVAGASADGKLGSYNKNATHLINMATKVVVGELEEMFVFGNTYNTKDGTCIRDYIHIDDLASAHLKAVEYSGSGIFNCGYGQGYSVKEVIETMKKVSGKDFKINIVGKRIGDIEAIVADNKKILTKMQWHPQYNDLDFICKSSLDWYKKQCAM